MPSPNIFQSTFPFDEFVPTCKKWGFFLILLWRSSWFKILQSDWPRTFWPISQEPDYPQILYLCKNTANNINFHYRPKSGKKILTKFSNKFKKKLFLVHFLGKDITFEKSSYVKLRPHGPLTLFCVPEKTKDLSWPYFITLQICKYQQ